jgi:hypothetical protein
MLGALLCVKHEGPVSFRARLFASLPDRPDGLRPGSAGNSLLLTLQST